MKVSISPEGNVELDVSNGETENAIELIQKLQQTNKEKESVRALEHAERIEKTTELNGWQYDLWNWLCDNDNINGIPIAAAARHFELTSGAMGQRLARLVKIGYASRPVNGRYRAKTP